MEIRIFKSFSIQSKRNLFSSFTIRIFLFAYLMLALSAAASAQDNSDCLGCHEDKTLKGKRNGRTISVFVDEKKLASSVHAGNKCIDCHVDLKDSDFPHKEDLNKAKCTGCHKDENQQYAESLHGIAAVKDKSAPVCQTCHGSHDIVPIKSPKSTVTTLKIPYLCGGCHHEGSPIQAQYKIPQDSILENYSESIHGDAVLRKGLIVAPTCISCHSAHEILPHTDSRSTIARKNISTTCTKCHASIEMVHRKIINGALWEKKANVLPVCVDCHQPHKIRNVFYTQGMADRDCLRCHEKKEIGYAKDGSNLYVDIKVVAGSVHAKVACSQCHSSVNASHLRPCEGITKKVDCSTCHAEIVDTYNGSIHGQLFSKNNPNAPGCLDCHGSHGILNKKNPKSPTFAINVPFLCAKCHREGQKAAVRYTGTEHNIIESYTESIHGKGLMKSGMTITATCADCHTAHHELPHSDPASSVNRNNVSATCGQCHFGIQEQFDKSVHSPNVTKTDKDLPACNDCHTAHTIRRTDQDSFKLTIMTQCGRCHSSIAKTYFDTYHGKVSQLGYTKTAKCYDCHGSHDILKVSDPNSHLSYQNIVKTCQKCHSGANRQFAGYFTHATHHDPDKYPWLYWTFFGMTGLLVGTFFFAGIHTLLWLPRSIQYRKELKRKLSKADKDSESSQDENGNANEQQ